MLKIWVKLCSDNRITEDMLYGADKRYARRDFHEHLREICARLDIPTPLILGSHISHFEKFNQCKFRAGEFVESVNFDELILENITE